MRSVQTLVVFISALIPVSAWAAPSREIVELQRDVAALQDQVRTLQRALDGKMSALQTLVQQTVDNSTKSNMSVAVLDSAIRDRTAEQQKMLVAPIANLTTKMDQMSSDFGSVRESVADMSERMNKLQTQITDLGNTVRTLNAPPAPPPTAGPGTGAQVGAPGAPPPGMSPTQVYETAMRDRSGGNLDLAQQGFQEYLRYFSNTDLAPNAQFYLGQIAYDKGDFPASIRNFDTVLEKFPENSKTADATFMKGMALLKVGQRDAAAKEFLNVSTKYPNSEVAAKAKAQRKALGLTTPAAGAALSAKPPARKRR